MTQIDNQLRLTITELMLLLLDFVFLCLRSRVADAVVVLVEHVQEAGTEEVEAGISTASPRAFPLRRAALMTDQDHFIWAGYT